MAHFVSSGTWNLNSVKHHTLSHVCAVFRRPSVSLLSVWQGVHSALFVGVARAQAARRPAGLRLQAAPRQAVRVRRVRLRQRPRRHLLRARHRPASAHCRRPSLPTTTTSQQADQVRRRRHPLSIDGDDDDDVDRLQSRCVASALAQITTATLASILKYRPIPRFIRVWIYTVCHNYRKP